MSEQTQSGPEAARPEEHYTDALELAFDAIKRVEIAAQVRQDIKGIRRQYDMEILAGLWTGLAIAVEIRALRNTMENRP